MSREVRHDGRAELQVRFPFDRDLVDLIKTLPNRRWNAAERFWSIPERDVLELVELLEPYDFRFDAATRDAYAGQGGDRVLDGNDATVSPAVPRLPGLFDSDDGTDDDASGDSALPTEDFTVSRLNERVRQVLEEVFPNSIWLVGEISGFNRSAHKRHVGFQLVEREDDGKTTSRIDATLFERERQAIERGLSRAGDPFRLEDEVAVRMRVRVSLYVPWGSYRAVIEELDVHYTLGEAARRREEILRRLAQAGLVGRNTGLPMPTLPLRVGLVTSLGSDAYNDVLRTLQDSGYAFRVLAHGARVQGHATEASVLNALEALRERSDELDVVLICRGGGSRTDLAWFDSESLGRAVALFPLPVVVGIGHEQDFSVLDEVARRCKTPTAAAALLVESVRRSQETVEHRASEVLALASRRLARERQRGGEWGRRLFLAAGGLLAREREQLGHRRTRAVRAVLGELARRRTFLDHVGRAVTQAARRDLATAGQRVEELGRWISPRARRRLAHAGEGVAQWGRRLHLVDPRRVLDRGYAILRTEDGRVLQDARLAPSGTPLRARLKRGSLQLHSKGPVPESGGD